MIEVDLKGSSSRRVIRGKYTGAPGDITIPMVDPTKAFVNITTLPWTANGGSTGSPKEVSGITGVVSVFLKNSTTLEIDNRVAKVTGYSARISYVNVPVYWEIIEG